MNAKSLQMILLAVVFALAFQEGSAIKCFQCDTWSADNEGKKCPGDYKSMDCPHTNQTMCRKVEQEINIKGEDTTRSTYQCATTGTNSGAINGECLERTGTYRFKSWYCECDTDSCNSGVAISTSVVLSVSALFVSLYRYL